MVGMSVKMMMMMIKVTRFVELVGGRLGSAHVWFADDLPRRHW